MEIWPAARLAIVAVMKKGDTLFGPADINLLCSRSMTSKAPMPLPTYTPTCSASSFAMSSPACATANSEAASANWMNRPIFLISLRSIKSSGTKSLTSPAMRQLKPLASKSVIGPMPDCPCSRAFQVMSVPTPTGLTKPTPVTTTRRSGLFMLMRAQGPSSTRDLDVADDERKFEGGYPGIDWCERGDSSPHGLPRQILSLVRLPISPLSHNMPPSSHDN